MFTRKFLRVLITVFVVVSFTTMPIFATGGEHHHVDLGSQLPMWSVLPFVGMLLSIAVFPLVKPHWWEENMLKVSIFWSLLFLVPFGIFFGMGMLTFQVLEIILLDYLPFIVLLFGLFVAAGGIALKGTLVGTTKVNLTLLLIGTLLASWIGTTGAAMLLIRPLIKANAWRKRKAHIVVFFIFMVANIGGCLTPVGDPPLFLGFLRGVPFFWTMNLLPLMIFNIGVLALTFGIMDKYLMQREMIDGRHPNDMVGNEEEKQPLKLEGLHNLIFIAMILIAVILNGIVLNYDMFADQVTGALHGLHIMGVLMPYNSIMQIVIILVAAFLSMKTTKKSIRELNKFTFAPIEEVAQLFIGIFLTMIPALALLKSHGAELGVESPAQFFWATGILSSFLDNAPTYLVFLTTAGSVGGGEGVVSGILTTVGFVPSMQLLAISAGAVFMGANTYIGNAPNFMVKSIAEENKIKMPSFFGYMLWSGAILIPLFVLDMIIFLL